MNRKVECVAGEDLDVQEVLAVYRRSGLGERRPIAEIDVFTAMLRNANLIVVCRIDGELVGIARNISDFSYVTYVADLAVARERQNSGIGRALVDVTRQQAERAKLVLLSAPDATGYYPRIGFSRHNSAWALNP